MAEKKKRKRSTGKLDRVHTHAGGVDIGSTLHVAAVSGKITESPVHAVEIFTALCMQITGGTGKQTVLLSNGASLQQSLWIRPNKCSPSWTLTGRVGASKNPSIP